MKILGIDTSTTRGGVALLEDSRAIGVGKSGKAESFSRSLLTAIDTLLSEHGISVSELGAIGVANGPGSFTGIRIGLSTIAGISLGTGIPIYGFSTLEAMAVSAARLSPAVTGKHGKVLPAIDAGKGNAYFAEFTVEEGEVKRLTDDTLADLNTIAGRGEGGTVHLLEEDGPLMGMLAERGCRVAGFGSEVGAATGVAFLAYMATAENRAGMLYAIRPNYVHGGPAVQHAV